MTEEEIIGGADGPTTIFLLDKSKDPTFRQRVQRRITRIKRSLQGVIEYLESDALAEDKVDCIESCYRSLYPPREGLSELYVFNKDADRMNEINSELERIKSELGRAVAEVLDQ